MVIDRFQLMGTRLDNKFQIDRFVAEGGFAAVYGGRHLVLERAIAVKVLKTPAEYNDGARENFIAKFRLEARIIARLSHPNIVQVIDFGVSRMPSGDEAPWMALEWLTGTSLEHELETRRGYGGRSGPEALAMLEPIFDALAYAHEEGLAHRDVKPGNIMLVSTKRGLSPKLLDFGIVKVMDEGEAVEKSFMRTTGTLTSHTPAYAAPEQITGLRTGPWTDVHALALLLTEVMTDQPPYDGRSANTLLREVLSTERPTPARRQVDAGPWEPILARALALEPKERYKDAGHFLAALKEAIPDAVKPIRTSSIPRVNDPSVDDSRFEKTFVRDSKPIPNDSVASPPVSSGFAGALSPRWRRAAFAVVILLALTSGYFAIHRLASSAQAPPPIVSSSQAMPEQKSDPPVTTSAPFTRQPTSTGDPLASEEKLSSSTVADSRSPPSAATPLADTGHPATEAPVRLQTDRPASSKRRTSAVRKAHPKPRIELE